MRIEFQWEWRIWRVGITYRPYLGKGGIDIDILCFGMTIYLPK